VISSIVFTFLLFITIPPYALGCLLLRPFGRRAAFGSARAWGRLIAWLARNLCDLHYTVEGRENMPADAAIVMSKHSSAYETIMLLLIVPWHCWVLKRELMWAPFFGWGLAALGPIAIDRSAGRSAVEQVVEQGTKRLAEGSWVVIFPEGTRMAPGETRRYGISGTLLAQAANRPLVPIAHNAADFWLRRGLRKKPGVVRFVIGRPVSAAGRHPREVNDELQSWVEATVAQLRSEQGLQRS